MTEAQGKVREKGTVLWKISQKFSFAAEKIIPDSFVFCVILMILVFVLSLVIGKGPIELLDAWWGGLSSQFTLAFQMGLMVIVCATCARRQQSF